MTRATKIAGILSGAFAIILTLMMSDWSNSEDIIFSMLASLILAGLLFAAVQTYLRQFEKGGNQTRERPKFERGGNPYRTKTGDSAGNLAALFIIGLAAYGMYAMDWGFSKGQITDYVLKCTSGDYTNSRCRGSYVQGPVTVYTVNADKQIVIRQVEGEPPARMSKCAVVDRQNWKCDASEGDDFVSVAYTDGEYQGVLRPPFFVHVARYEWLWAYKAAVP